MTVTLTLTFMVLSAQLGLGWDSKMTGTTWSDLLVSVFTLHRTFYLTDILLLYTLLVLAAVPVLVLLVHTQTALVLAGSWGLWMLWQLAPQHAQFPWVIAGNSVFNFPAGQVLFVTAIVIGYHRQRLEQQLARVSEHLVLGISGTFVAAVIGIYVVAFLASSSPHVMLVERLFGKVDLRVGRLLVFAGFYPSRARLASPPSRPGRAERLYLAPLRGCPGGEGEAVGLLHNPCDTYREHRLPINRHCLYLDGY
jgi:hypothetical protein